MKKNLPWVIPLLGFLVLAVAVGDLSQQSHTLTASGYYVREAEDRQWNLRIVGEIPSLCGAYVIVHDANGRTVHHGVIPHGKYDAGDPFVIKIPKDGTTGDYKVILVGHESDIRGINVPLTDLPEVCGGRSFSSGEKNMKMFFQVPQGVKKMTVAGYKGHLQVYRGNGQLVADTRKDGKYGGSDRKSRFRYSNYIEVPVVPDEVYYVQKQCLYIRFDPAVFLTFDPERWFYPDPKLDEVKWWKGVME